MLRLTVSPEEYLLINGSIKIVFLRGTKNYLRIIGCTQGSGDCQKSCSGEQDTRCRGKGKDVNIAQMSARGLGINGKWHRWRQGNRSY